MGKRKVLLLVFVHGFKGDDDTFGEFPEHLKAITRHSLPNTKIITKVFPRYDTRGELSTAVSNLRTWLQDLVIDIESYRGNRQPMVDPSVRTVIVCHSMGGIVAADMLLSIVDEPSVSGTADRFMFPYIQGILAFDTPYLGLAPGMFAHSADANIKTASAALNNVAALASGLFAAKKATEEVNETPYTKEGGTGMHAVSASHIPPEGAKAASERRDPKAGSSSSRGKELERRGSTASASSSKSAKSSSNATSTTPGSSSTTEQNQSPAWQRWSKLAVFAGAAATIAAGGAAAYFKREEIAQGFGWASSHLEFVRELIKSETLRKRLTRCSSIEGVGFANFYTSLGDRRGLNMANANDATKKFLSQERMFCSEPGPGSEYGKFWHKAVNPMATDEIEAHTGMFSPKTNPGYYAMSNEARDLLVQWSGGMK